MRAILMVLMVLVVTALAGPAGASPWISTRTHATCAVMEMAYGGYPAKQLYCWGDQTHCLMSSCASSDTSYPTPKTGASDVKMVARYDYGTCFLTHAGAVKCWGYNDEGQMGANPAIVTHTLAINTVIASGIGFISAGEKHVCALSNTTGEVKCWGRNNEGQLGNGTTNDSYTPVTAIGSGIAFLSAGGNTTCARPAASSTVKCWGERHGNSSPAGNQVTPTVVGGLTSVATIQVGDDHVCVEDTDAVKCWGLNTWGQLGNNSTTSSATPVAATVLTTNVAGVLAGPQMSCGVLNTGATYCWGRNDQGELGLGDTTDRDEPTQITAFTAVAGSWLSIGTDNACAYVAPAGGGYTRYYCWGAGADKQLGANFDGTWPSNPRTTPFEFYFWGGPN